MENRKLLIPLLAALVLGDPRPAEALTLAQHTQVCQNDARVIAGVVPLDVCVGANIFFRETFNGNGRTCATCHRVERNFAIDPEFIPTLPSNDPLFVAEFNPILANLERPAQMRAHGLILENVDGTQPDPNIRFVLRSVPHNLSMGVSITSPARSADTTGRAHRMVGGRSAGARAPGRLHERRDRAAFHEAPEQGGRRRLPRCHRGRGPARGAFHA